MQGNGVGGVSGRPFPGARSVWEETVMYRHPVTGERFVFVPLLQRVEAYAKGSRTSYLWVFVNHTGTDPNHPLVWRAVCDLLAGRYDERRGEPKIQA